jgi:hypothetical protein
MIEHRSFQSVRERQVIGTLTAITLISMGIEQRNLKTITTATTSQMVLMAVVTYLQLAKASQFTPTIGHMSARQARDIKALGLQRITYIRYENNISPHFFDWIFYGKSEC